MPYRESRPKRMMQGSPRKAEAVNDERCDRDRVADGARTADAIKFYTSENGTRPFSEDPRCLWGWGGCGCMFGHACFRPFGHAGKCWDGGDKPQRGDMKCAASQRPKDWDATGRAEANR